jgi:hypothetical protein
MGKLGDDYSVMNHFYTPRVSKAKFNYAHKHNVISNMGKMVRDNARIKRKIDTGNFLVFERV